MAGSVLLAATIIPNWRNAIYVLAHQGSKAIAYSVHGVTAAVMVVVAGLLLFAAR